MTKFSTKFENPVKTIGYPLTLGLIIEEGSPAPLYFQRRFLDINRELLETKSTIIPESEYGKYLRLSIGDSILPCAAFIETFISDTEVNTTGYCPGDTGPPSITLLGYNPQYVIQNGNYVEQGATANDPDDGDLTGSIVVAGNPDASTVGTYSVTYTVTDSDGFTTSVERLVYVTAERVEPRLQLSGGGSGINLSSNMVTFNNHADTVTIEGWFNSFDDMFAGATEDASTLFSIQSDNALTGAASDSFQIAYGNSSSSYTGEIISIARVDNYASPTTDFRLAGHVVPNAEGYANADIHIAVVIEPGQDWKLYINAVPVALTPATGLTPMGTAYGPTNGFLAGLGEMVYMHLGARYIGGVRDNSLHGEMWNWRWWSTARTQTQIAEGMTAEYTAAEPGLVEQWLINETVGTVAEGTKGNDGTIIGGTWYGGASPEPVPEPEPGTLTGDTYTGTTLTATY